jgi:uncharacterized protein (TIGR02266 family)
VNPDSPDRLIRRRILVVDDSPVFLELEETFLSRIGHVLTARRGEDALELARRERPDVVLADLNMPGMSGDELCRRIKSDVDLARTPVVLVAGESNPEDHERAVRSGADDVVSKPVNRLLLIQAVGRFLKLAVRGLVRVPVEAEVHIDQSGHQAWGRAINVSRGGMYIESPIAPEPPTELTLDFKLPISPQALTPTAQVMWRRPGSTPDGGGGIGVRFLKLDPDASKLLDDFVYERSEGNYEAAQQPGRVTPVR